jgi:uracil DNA glycosylase
MQSVHIQNIYYIKIEKILHEVYEFVHINPKIEHFFSASLFCPIDKCQIIKVIIPLAQLLQL